MYPARITAVSLFAIGIVTLVAAALPDQAERRRRAIPVLLYSLAPTTTVQVLEQAEEVVAVSEEITPLYSDEDVAAIAKTVYGEALITHSDMEMAAVAWCILNRVDSAEAFFPDTIVEVVTQDSQFHGYSESNPVDPHIEWLVRDVLDRWSLEKAGAEEVGLNPAGGVPVLLGRRPPQPFHDRVPRRNDVGLECPKIPMKAEVCKRERD